MDIDSPAWSHLLIDGAAALGVGLRPEHARLFARHAAELLKWNAVTNLTSIIRPEAIARNHFLDSLAAARFLAPGDALLDVGSGGGFPGVPLHVAVDGLQTVLLDAVRKKVSFLRHLVRELGLTGIEARHQRVEEIGGRATCRRSFDVVTSRAFSAPEALVSAVWPLLRPGGRVVLFRGLACAAEMDASRYVAATAEREGSITVERVGYSLPGLTHARSLLIVRAAS